MKVVVALVCSVTVLLAGCFPNNPARRRQAKYVEGAALIAGIAVSAVANTGTDCDQMDMMSTTEWTYVGTEVSRNLVAGPACLCE